MDLNNLQKKLLAAARADSPSDRVPYAFEKRVMARLGRSPVRDLGALWAQALWRATAPCAAIMLLLGAWAVFAPDPQVGSTDFSEDFENTVLAAVVQDSGSDYVW